MSPPCHRQVEAAHETLVLGAMQPGYRCVPLRDKLGTPIDLCSLLILVDAGTIDRPLENDQVKPPRRPPRKRRVWPPVRPPRDRRVAAAWPPPP